MFITRAFSLIDAIIAKQQMQTIFVSLDDQIMASSELL